MRHLWQQTCSNEITIFRNDKALCTIVVDDTITEADRANAQGIVDALNQQDAPINEVA